jgi:hypothetical protein
MKGKTIMDFLRNLFGKKQPAATPSNNEVPDVVVVYYDRTPAHVDAFIMSVCRDLHITIGPVTTIAHYQDSNAASLIHLLPGAVVVGMKHLSQRAMELDGDRTGYEYFEARSPQEAGSICGHVIQLYAKVGKRTPLSESGKPGDALQIGMPFSEVVQLLGEPSGVNPGTEMLEAGPHHQVVASEETHEQLARTSYYMWKRPEGMYLLVIEDGKLARIQGRP